MKSTLDPKSASPLPTASTASPLRTNRPVQRIGSWRSHEAGSSPRARPAPQPLPPESPSPSPEPAVDTSAPLSAVREARERAKQRRERLRVMGSPSGVSVPRTTESSERPTGEVSPAEKKKKMVKRSSSSAPANLAVSDLLEAAPTKEKKAAVVAEGSAASPAVSLVSSSHSPFFPTISLSDVVGFDFDADVFCDRLLHEPLSASLASIVPAGEAAASSETASTPAEGVPPGFYGALAERLCEALHRALRDVDHLREAEEKSCRRSEVQGKQTEIREKRRLTSTRQLIEGNSAILQQYIAKIGEAQLVTSSMGHQLAQSNARVHRGKSVIQLLSYLELFKKIDPIRLYNVLKGLSRARVHQRRAIMHAWEKDMSGTVGFYDPVTEEALLAFETANEKSKSGGTASGGGSKVAKKRLTENTSSNGVAATSTAPADPLEGTTSGKKKKVVTVVKKKKKKMKNARDGLHEGDEEEERASGKPSWIVLRDAEAAAAGLGLDPLFISRVNIDAQVDWTQRLLLLTTALNDVAPEAHRCIIVYLQWLQQELVNDVFQVIEQFNVLHHKSPRHANLVPFGRALLKTITKISRMRSALVAPGESMSAGSPTSPSGVSGTRRAGDAGEGLLHTFIERVIPPFRVSLHSTYMIPPFNAAPFAHTAEGGSSSAPFRPKASDAGLELAMDHWEKRVKPTIPNRFRFLIERVRRELVVVEAITGSGAAHHPRIARQQFLLQVITDVLQPFIEQQIKLSEHYRDYCVQTEGQLSPRSKRRVAVRVVDAIDYYHTIVLHCYQFFHAVCREFCKEIDAADEEELHRFLAPFGEAIFTSLRERYAAKGEVRVEVPMRGAAHQKVGGEELYLLQRQLVYVDELHTRALHPLPDKPFDLRDAHHAKAKSMLNALTHAATRVRLFALEKDCFPLTLAITKLGLQYITRFLMSELKKGLESLKQDKEKWRVKPTNVEELLHPSTPEAQSCCFRLLFFVQGTLSSLFDTLASMMVPLLPRAPRSFGIDMETLQHDAFAPLDELAEQLLNLSVNAVLVKSLSILQHYQLRTDFMAKEVRPPDVKAPTALQQQQQEAFLQAVTAVPCCSRACTVFCHYITRQFIEARELIHTSILCSEASESESAETTRGKSGTPFTRNASPLTPVQDAPSQSSELALLRLKVRSMNMAQLLYGDGKTPSTLTRTLGVCLYRGIAAHLKSCTVNDRGALVYKQDVAAYAEAMKPLTSLPTLSGAVVDVLFRLLKETSGLLLMPLDRIKEIKNQGLLQLLPQSEKNAFLKIRQDVRAAFRAMNK